MSWRRGLRNLRDFQGQALALGRELGRGGEGAVYEVQGNPSLVAKLYLAHIPPAKAIKLTAMMGTVTQELLRVAAWPTSVILEGNRVSGLLMPKVTGYEELHQLYGPKHRRKQFPEADWGFLVHTARNLAAAINTVHRHGHVVGDLNQNNLVVSKEGTIKLIDCDSFQISVNGSKHLCEVGVPDFTPPELHGRSFAGVVRTANHDAFGLAVTIFHLLFLGRHPFAGRFQGGGDMPIERAIREYRFAYSQHAATRQMLPPPTTLALAHLSYGIASLFERAFAPGGERGGRPTAQEWFTAIGNYQRELRRCATAGAHAYHQSLSLCPLCEIERTIKSDLFLVVLAAAPASAKVFDLNALWRQVLAVSVPAAAMLPAPAPPVVSAQPLPSSMRTAMIASWLVMACAGAASVPALSLGSGPGWVGLLVCAFIWWILQDVSGIRVERKTRKARAESADHNVRGIINQAKQESEDAERRFRQMQKALEGAREVYRELPGAEQKALHELARQREASQRRHHLERHFIEQAGIPGIGGGLTATLASYGIETAADVDPSIAGKVPGFGPSRTAELLAWRAAVESQFRFDPSRGVDPADRQAIRNHYARLALDLERQLTAGPSELQRLSSFAQQRQANALAQLHAFVRELAQAQADVKAVA